MAKATAVFADKLDIPENRNKLFQVLTQDPAKISMKIAELVLGFQPKPFNTSYEAISCVGYHPGLEELTATISIKRPTGYNGPLCSSGSIEYVRFYMDFGPGGWQDMGYTGVNVHDIPDAKDCNSKLKKPISYTLRLKINPKHFVCKKANLPKVRAVLCWNAIPPANDPNCTSGFPYLWADRKDVRVQVRPLFILDPLFGLDLVGPVLEKALLNPAISLSSLADFIPGGKEKLLSAKAELEPPKLEIAELVKGYKELKQTVEPHRIGMKLLDEAIQSPDIEKIKFNESLFVKAGMTWKESLMNLQKLKYNTEYEQIFCAGLDYHNEALVGTLQIKRPGGYHGDLCHRGSKEYVTFWIQGENCEWKQIGTASVNVHDLLGDFPKEGISYSVVLPVDLSEYRRKCDTPVVLKLRAILSWNTPAVGFRPSYWGNVLDSYIQIRPGKPWDGKNPQLITVGGVSVDNINAISGLTKPGAKIEINQTATHPGSPFGGIIVVQALCNPFEGTKYRIRVKNLNTNAEYFVNNDLHLLGISGGSITHPVNVADPLTNCYKYLPFNDNINSVVALWTPGTNDRLRITIENMGADGLTFTGAMSQVIQLDNIAPVVTLDIDGGGCSNYSKGDKITGKFSVNDAWLLNYVLSSSFAAVTGTGGIPPSGTFNGSGTFEIQTLVSSNPCGSVNLVAYEKTIYNSVTTNNYTPIQRIICLKEKKND